LSINTNSIAAGMTPPHATIKESRPGADMINTK